ncbi:MAG: hypothetical protein CMJ46_03115 [Planctomyces sp.]|nr:hypothetical protein [Planctomyces sp.]
MEGTRAKPVIPLQALTVTQSLDMGMLAVRTHFKQIYKTALPFTLVACTVAYALNHFFNIYSLLMFPLAWLLIVPMGDLLIYKVAERQWIVPIVITDHGRERLAKSHRFSILGWGLLRQVIQIALLALLIIPGVIYFRRTLFLPERLYFDNPDSKIQQRVWKELRGGEAFSLDATAIGLGGYWMFLSFLFFLFLDLSCTLLFDFPLFFVRLGEDASFLYLSLYDPYVIVAAVASLMLVFPVIRMAWFFCYVSIRVKYDCWDIATSISREAERLRISMED